MGVPGEEATEQSPGGMNSSGCTKTAGSLIRQSTVRGGQAGTGWHRLNGSF